MGAMGPQITSLAMVYSTVQRKPAFIQAQIKENLKAPRHWPLCGVYEWPGRILGESIGTNPQQNLPKHMLNLGWGWERVVYHSNDLDLRRLLCSYIDTKKEILENHSTRAPTRYILITCNDAYIRQTDNINQMQQLFQILNSLSQSNWEFNDDPKYCLVVESVILKYLTI